MNKIYRKSEPEHCTWHPVGINKLRGLLHNTIYKISKFPHDYALRSNIGYNLQYLEYLEKSASDLDLNVVILTQTWKTFIIVGCSIIEALLKYLLIRDRHHKTTLWKETHIFSGNERKIRDGAFKIDNHIYKKMSKPELEEMTFDAMLKVAEAKKILGRNEHLYPKLKYLKKLRNKIHLQEIKDSTDTDWNSFNQKDFVAMTGVLYLVFTSNLFSPSAEQKKYFDYLKKYNKT